jgi:hypothetical protein
MLVFVIASRRSGRSVSHSSSLEVINSCLSKVKLFRSLEWEGKLESYIKIFDDHKQALHEDLALHASIGIQQVHTTVLAVSATAQSVDYKTSMLLLLEALRSPVERELMREIDANGGPDKVLKDENLMKKLIEKSGEKSDAQGSSKTMSKDGLANVLKEISRDISKSFADMIKENEEQFIRKFESQKEDFATEMKAMTRREGDRVIGAILSGPHDRIVDPVR